MQREHRGHIIRLVEGFWLGAELIERETGTVLPTMVTASASEGCEVLAARACDLIDLYLDAEARIDRRAVRRPSASVVPLRI